MLLRKGRFIERRRVAYRLVGLVRGEARVLSPELYADAREAQAAVESAVPEDEPLEQVTLQRGEESPAEPPSPGAAGSGWDALDPLGCRWEVIKRWGPDVIARIRRQRFGHAASARFPSLTETSPAPAGGVAETLIDDATVAPHVDDDALTDIGPGQPIGAAPPTGADTPVDERLPSEELATAGGAPAVAERLEDVATPGSATEPTESRTDIDTHAAEAVEPTASETSDASRFAESVAEDAIVAAPATAESLVEPGDAAPVPPIESTPPAAFDEPPARGMEIPPAPVIEASAAPPAHRRSLGALIRTSAVVTLLLLAILLFETCSNPFAWLTGEAVGNEIRSLPFTNQPTGGAAPTPPAAGSPSLSARRP